MAHHYIDTPRTEAADRTRMTLSDVSLSEMPSFYAPPGADDLLKATRGNNPRQALFATPSARVPLANRRNPPAAKAEFTPLLHSAARNRMQMRDQGAKGSGGKLNTPAGLKAGYMPSSPHLPEASMLDSQLTSEDATPMPMVESSSAMSTPMPVLPKRGELGIGADGGNVLTLREQEAKLEQIDKENFGLKLKIHFLEENLKKTGSEWNQQTIRENTELKTNSILLERELKRYRRQLKTSEDELELYRQQLADYVDKVKRRHMDEAMRDEVEKLHKVAEERAAAIQELREQLEKAEGNAGDNAGDNDELEKLREQVEDLESELKNKEQAVEEKEDKIEELEAKLSSARGDLDEEAEEKDQQIESQAEEIEELRREIETLKERKEMGEAIDDRLEAAEREHEADLRELRNQVEAVEKAKRDQLHAFESQLQTWTREKNADYDALQRKLEALEKDKANEIESLELRLKLAESQGDNQSQLARQAAEDSREKLRLLTLEKDGEIESLQSQLNTYEGLQDDLESCERRLRNTSEDVQRLEADAASQEVAMAELRDSLSEKQREIQSLRNTIKEQEGTSDQVDKLQLVVTERTSKLAALQKTVDTQSIAVEEVKELRSKLSEHERLLHISSEDVKRVQSEVNDRDRQMETLRRTLKEKSDELDVLRNNADEPDSQIEGLHSIVRHREHDLQELRDTVNEQAKNLELLQKSASDRLEALENLRSELAETKQNHEDEIVVLERSLDEAEDKIAMLTKDVQGTQDVQAKLEPLERKLRSVEREKARHLTRIEELQRDQEVTDAERLSLQSEIQKLRVDLETTQKAAKTVSTMSPLPKGSSAELRALRIEQQDLHLRLVEAESALQSAEFKHRQSMQEKTRQHSTELKNIHRTLKDKDRQLRELEADETKGRHMQAKVQQKREEVGRLTAQMADMEKRHVAEIRGLVKQIQFLRAKIAREELFRDALAWQKTWFLMRVDMYDACNMANLRLIEEMGISPDRTFRHRKPTLKIVAHVVRFCVRAKKASEGWKEKRLIQESLVRKVDAMRGRVRKTTMR